MQIFVTGLGAQAERFQVPIELVIVDWNPPAEKPLLADAIDWPGTDWVESRVVEVPAELHRRYKHADSLPLYQMIAKNVGRDSAVPGRVRLGHEHRPAVL